MTSAARRSRSVKRLAVMGLLLAFGMGGCAKPALDRASAFGAGAVPGSVTVIAGDTLYALARRHDVALERLIEVNRLRPPYALRPGQTLLLPEPAIHVVREGDTIYQVARCAGIDMAALAHANRLTPPYVISPGQRLRLPPSTQRAACPDEAVAAAARDSAAPARREPAASTPPVHVARSAPAVAPGPVSRPPARAASRFLWPVEGEIISDYGPKDGARRNNGINIAAAAGTPVRAAENGVVVYAGNELRGYGNLLLLRHADGWTTAYAHNSELLVARGATVKRGEVIARVGQTGSVSRPQSHFELRKGAAAVDPVDYLAPH